jgi:hypothetical protein
MENNNLTREEQLISIAVQLSQIPFFAEDWTKNRCKEYQKELFNYAYDLHNKNCSVDDILKVFKEKYNNTYLNALEVVLFLLDAWQNKNYLKFYSKFIDLKFEKNLKNIFYGKKEYEAFRYIINEFSNKDRRKVLFKILWFMYNKILIKCKGDNWDEWIHKEYFPNEKVSKIAGKFDGNTGSPLFQKVLRISKQYPDQKILEYS